MSHQPQDHSGNHKAKKASNTEGGQQAKTKGAPMIVERVNKIPFISMAISMGFAQYSKLKSSNVTIGDVMTRAENLAGFLWNKLRPVVDKFEEPISRVDKAACAAIDYVESFAAANVRA